MNLEPQDSELTKEELINILCIFDNRLLSLESRIDTFSQNFNLLIDKVSEQLNFQDIQIISLKCDELEYNQKTPKKKIEELENSLKGFIQHYYSKDTTNSTNRINRYNKYIYTIAEKDE